MKSITLLLMINFSGVAFTGGFRQHFRVTNSRISSFSSTTLYDTTENSFYTKMTDFSFLPKFKFPAAESELHDLSASFQNIVSDWGLLGTTFKGPEWLSIFDISRLPFLNGEYQSIIADLPVWLRLTVGISSIEIVPLLLDIFVFVTLWNKFTEAPKETEIRTNLPKVYDKNKIASFYSKYPGVVVRRTLEIFNLAQPFVFGLLSDQSKNEFEKNAPVRATQLRELISILGPTAIKIGQAISVRPDLLSKTYISELQKLQDQVPPFDSTLAIEIIEKSFNEKLSDVFLNSIDSFKEPVAAASLGQVYKAQFKDSKEYVAVKVQRPNMKIAVTLDLYIIRLLLEFGEKYFPRIREECKAFIMVVDNWAGRFVDELDYEKEVQNCELFRQQMTDTGTLTLGDVIVVPKMYTNFCTSTVLVSEWIEGTKLNKIDVSEEKGRKLVQKLTQVLLNCYLVQLLETGFLHSDPHPGNFLVTNYGKLCILDYGLMTTVDEDKRFALIEYISHLSAKDYDATLDDLIVLEFIPQAVNDDLEKRKIVAPMLAQVLSQLSAGGGAASLNVDEVGRQIDGLSKQYPIIIPAYFGLVVRAFGALEGLGLSVDPSYSIVKACFPYLSKRLLSDDSPRIRVALKTFLYGREKTQLDMKRLDELAEGYCSFSTVSAEAASGQTFSSLKFDSQLSTVTNGGSNNAVATSNTAIDPVLSSIVKILFSTQGNYVQEIIMDEAVRITDALSRSLIVTAVSFNPLQSFTNTVMNRNRNNNLNGGGKTSNVNNNPVSIFLDTSKRLEALFKPSPEDIQSLRTLKRLLQILAGVSTSASSADSAMTNTASISNVGLAVETDAYDNDILVPVTAATALKSAGATGGEGKVDINDLQLFQKVITQTTATLFLSSRRNNGSNNRNKSNSAGFDDNEQFYTQDSYDTLNNNNNNNANQLERLNIIRTQLKDIVPLLRDTAPGVRKLSGLFVRKLLNRSLTRIADTIDARSSSSSPTVPSAE